MQDITNLFCPAQKKAETLIFKRHVGVLMSQYSITLQGDILEHITDFFTMYARGVFQITENIDG